MFLRFIKICNNFLMRLFLIDFLNNKENICYKNINWVWIVNYFVEKKLEKIWHVYHRQLLAESRSEIPQRLNSSKLVFKWHFFKTKIHRTLTAEVGESQPRRKVCNVLRLEPSNESIWITLLHTDGIPTPDSSSIYISHCLGLAGSDWKLGWENRF